MSFLTPLLAQTTVNAQIAPVKSDTGTTVQQNQNLINISGGKTSANGSNLFHSFSQFNVNTGQVANFLSTPNIQNILGRVNGGSASIINGTLQVTGSNANLFLINPAGIVFGANASLNLPASFTATTATGINFNNGQFNAIGNNDYTNLFGNPTAFTFGLNQPGSIVNGGNLSVSPNQNINLVGGTVVSTGTVNAPKGNVNVAAVPGTSLVRVSQPGNLLSLEIPGAATVNFTPATLPQLLTGSGISGITVAGTNVNLDRTNIPIKPGDVVVNKLAAGTATVAAANNLNLIGSNLKTTGDLTLRAQNTVAIKDSKQDLLNITAGQKLLIQGDKKVDIFALNNPQTNISAGSDLLLRSITTIGGDAYFNTGGNFRIEQLDGKLGGLFSPYDPIIRASGDVLFGDYSGASLHIIAGGKVETGNITITGLDGNNGLKETPDITLADGTRVKIDGKTIPTLDIRAGVSASALGTPLTPANQPQPVGTAPLQPSITVAPKGSSITVGNINFSSSDFLSTANPTFVLLTNQYAPNLNLLADDIKAGNINTLFTPSALSTDPNAAIRVISSGDITIIGRNNINLNQLTTGTATTPPKNFSGTTNTGNILVKAIGNINATGLISTENLDASSTGSGNITLTSVNGTVTTDRVSTQINRGNSTNSKAGNIDITAAGAIVTRQGKDLDTRALTSNLAGTSGNITLKSTNGSIDTINVLTAGGTIKIEGKTNVKAVELNTGITSGNITTKTGDITVSTDGNINATGLISSENLRGETGNITLTSTQGAVDTKGITTQRNGGNSNSPAKSTGDININAAKSISTEDLNATSFNTTSSSAADLTATTAGGNSGNIKLVSSDESIVVKGRISTQGSTLNGQSNKTAGNVEVNAKNNITITNIATPGDLGGTVKLNSGNNTKVNLISTVGKTGGNVSINSGNDTEIGSIITGSTDNGGTINISAGRFFRATSNISDFSTFFTPENFATFGNSFPGSLQSSIYSNGNLTSGAITIRHGGNGLTPFEIGNPTTNGTKGAIVSSNNALNPQQSLLVSKTQGNIQIITKAKTTTSEQNCLPNCSTPPPKVDPPKIKQPIKSVDPDPVEITISKDFGDLKPFNKEKPQDILRKIQTSTGVKPAIIYATFSPPNLGLEIAKDKNTISELARNNFQLDLVLVTQNGEPVRHTIPISREKMLQTVKQFRKEVTNPKNATAFMPTAQQLYKWLIAPLEQDLKQRGIQNLVFIMDSGLRGVPMAALHDGKQFLVERYSVGAMPSVSLVDTRYVDIRKAKVLAMGAENTPDQDPLPAVPVELKTIASTIWNGKSLENDQFTATNLVAQRQQQPFGILHLATHGEFKPGGPENSYIQFKNERLGFDRFRQLKLNEPPVELMVLSACRTALGDEDAELGFAGSAARTGVKSVMGSLWYVSDEGTLSLMTSFYRNLQTAPIKAEALRQTQVAMLTGKVRLQAGKLISGNDKIDLPQSMLKLGDVSLTHPFYWSAFTIVGNPW